MLSQEQNDRLTRVGPGTPMGDLMRRYWHPIAGSIQVNTDNPTKEIRLLGEDLVLFRSASGQLGLIEPSCPHRKANLSYGVPEEEGIRCAYHGWLFDAQGNCVDQPSEPIGSRFKDKVHIKAYKVEELGGLVFAYLGPAPAPLLPRWDILVWPGIRSATSVMLPCNWLQCHENSLDPLHFQWLHRYYGTWVMNRRVPKEEREEWNARTLAKGDDHRKIGFELTQYGIIKRRLVGDDTEEEENWKLGHPILFPNILRNGGTLQYRVPVDDTHTDHLVFTYRRLNEGEDTNETVPFEDVSAYWPGTNRFRDDYVRGQDQMAWAIQGAIADRTTEHLGITDVGVIMFRRLLERQLRVIEDGGEPMNVHRDPQLNDIHVFPVERFVYPGYDGFTGGPFIQDSPRKPDVEAILSGEGARLDQDN